MIKSNKNKYLSEIGLLKHDLNTLEISKFWNGPIKKQRMF